MLQQRRVLISSGVLPALGMLLLTSGTADAFCKSKLGLECTERFVDGNGRPIRDGSRSCMCKYTDPNVQAEDFEKRMEIARKQEEEHIRKGGKPDRDNGIKKIWPSWLPRPF